MKGIPAHTVIDENTIKKLDEDFAIGFGKTSVMKFFGEFNEFLERSNLTVFGPNQIEKESLNNSVYLRNLIDQAGSGRNNIRIIKSPNLDPELVNKSHKRQLMNVLISEQTEGNSTFFNHWFKLKKMPEAWDIFSNNRKTTILVGGKRSIFKSWEDFGLSAIPVKSLVIIDPYLFNEAAEMRTNLPKIIEGLICSKPTEYPVNILFIVGGDVNKKFDPTSFISNRTGILNSIILDNFKEWKLNVSVAYIKGEFLHDRFIFSNYYYMDAGRGFNLYTGQDSINTKKPNKVTIKFLSGPDAFEEYEEAVQRYCEVVFDSKALIKLEGNLEGNEILGLFKKIF